MAQKGSLNIPYVLRPVGFLGDGQNRYVASPERYSTIGYNEIVQYAARAAHVPETDITMAMDALYDALSYFVCNGHGVKLPNLGIFSFGINAKAETLEAKAGADAVYRTKINFLPCKELRNVLDNVAITVTPLNPNGLAEGFATKASVRGINMKKGSGYSSALIPFRSYMAGASTVFVVKLAGPMAVTPTLSVVWGKDGQTSQLDLQGSHVGSNVIYDMANYISGQDSYEIEQLIVTFNVDGVAHSYVMPFSTSWGEFSAYEATLMGKTVSASLMDTPESPVLTDMLVNGSNRALEIRGINCNRAEDLGVSFDNGAAATIKTSSNEYLVIAVPEGVKVVTVTGEYISAVFTIAEGEQGEAVPVVTSLSANGVTVGNGQSSTIEVGKTYNFTLNGINLDKLPRDAQSFGAELIAAGATISIKNVDSNAIQFTLGNAKAGSFKVKNTAGDVIFTLTLTEYVPEASAPTISSINNVANGGSLQVTPNQETSLTVRGTNLTSLTAAGFSITNGQIVSVTGATATQATLKIKSNGGSGNALRYTINGSVIYQMSITAPNSGGDYDDHDGIAEW